MRYCRLEADESGKWLFTYYQTSAPNAPALGAIAVASLA